jgi:acyl carrier protein
MSMDSHLAEVQEIFRAVFDRPDLVITRESNASNVEDWDSLTHINLVMAIEKKYKIKFALGELKELENVGDLLDLIQKKLSAK